MVVGSKRFTESYVLGELVREGYITQTTGESDRRRRLLRLAPKGVELERQLSETQRQRVATAYRQAGGAAVAGFRSVMLGLMGTGILREFDAEG